MHSYPKLEPGFPVVWLHVGDKKEGRAIGTFCARLAQQRDDIQFVLTGASEEVVIAGQDALVYHVQTPPEAQIDCQDFLQWANPVVCFWSGNDLRPALLFNASQNGCRLVLINAKDVAFAPPLLKWIPENSAATLNLFSDVFVQETAAERRVRRLALPDTAIHNLGPLSEAATPLPSDPSIRDAVAEKTAGRPVWLASYAAQNEIGEVLRAHRQASRYAHRLLLVLSIDAASDREAALTSLRESGMTFCDWQADEAIEDATQVVFSSDTEALGLWLRISAVNFIGGSLVTGVGGHDPYEAAALGSAVLYGPNVGNHLAAYTRLAQGGAARITRDASSLASAVIAVIAPDQSATMAHAGWDIVSAGAEMTDNLIQIALDTLDTAEAV